MIRLPRRRSRRRTAYLRPNRESAIICSQVEPLDSRELLAAGFYDGPAVSTHTDMYFGIYEVQQNATASQLGLGGFTAMTGSNWNQFPQWVGNTLMNPLTAGSPSSIAQAESAGLDFIAPLAPHPDLVANGYSLLRNSTVLRCPQ